ncbi:hypothetical protein AAHH79_35770, partial [Burkholderia pseudomallei]
FLSTAWGTVTSPPLEALSRPLTQGISAVGLDDGAYLSGAAITDGAHDVMLFSAAGPAVGVAGAAVRAWGREGRGVRGVRRVDAQ